MDEGGHRENGRHKADQFKAAQNQWLMQHQPSMKHIVAIMAERDAALQERNLAMSEKKAALAERDMAILQRDAAIQERNAAIMERDNAIATLQYRDSTMNGDNVSTPPQGCQVTRGMKHMHHTQSEVPYGSRDIHIPDALSICPAISDPSKSRKVKRNKEAKTASFGKKGSRFARKQEEMGGDDLNKQLALSRPEWKTQDLGLNQVAFDDSTMPPPVCSCTGTLRQCYKWGNGGWQSSCCTTTISVYPLPTVPNKRHARIGGRKMSGSAFNKLLSRLASEGHDLSIAVDLKDHWARHGTNRYITIK